MRDTVTKKPRGFGFITFAKAETADAVCAEQHMIDGRQVCSKTSAVML
jgi:RNA recognition motif-containing protein